MKAYEFVVASSFDPAARDGSWICKRPSDQGPWVFVWFKEKPRFIHHYVIEITRVAPNGNSRQGRVAWVVENVQEELTEALKGARWFRDRNGDPWVKGLSVSVGTFDAYLVPATYSASWGDLPARIVFEPAEGSSFRMLKHELANFLESSDELERERAESAPFAPGIVPAPGKAQMVARLLAQRGLPVHAT